MIASSNWYDITPKISNGKFDKDIGAYLNAKLWTTPWLFCDCLAYSQRWQLVHLPECPVATCLPAVVPSAAQPFRFHVWDKRMRVESKSSKGQVVSWKSCVIADCNDSRLEHFKQMQSSTRQDSRRIKRWIYSNAEYDVLRNARY